MMTFGRRSAAEMERRAESIRGNHPDLWAEASAIVTAGLAEEMDEWTPSDFDAEVTAFLDREGETGLRVLWACARILGDVRIRRRCVLITAEVAQGPALAVARRLFADPSALAEDAVASAVDLVGMLPAGLRSTASGYPATAAAA